MVQTPRVTQLENQKRSAKNKWVEKAGTFTAILVVNVAILLMLGTMVIYNFVAPTIVEVMVSTKIKPVPPPPPKPPAKGGEAAKSIADPTTVVAPPPVTPPSVIVSISPSAIKFNASSSLSVSSLSLPTFAASASSGLAAGTTGGGLSHSNPFGDSPDSGVPGLIGELYDLKQTPDGTATPMAISPPETVDSYYPGFAGLPQTKEGLKVLREYVKSWNQDILDRYYKSPSALEATQIFIPTRHSEEATKAFKVQDKVTARRWVIHYHGTMIPPKTGRFRFLGFGDDFLVVRLGDNNVLDASYPGEKLDESANARDEDIPGPSGHHLFCGKWFNVDASQPMSIDILIGEGPGGFSGFVLLIEEDGDTSEKGDYPVFQMAPATIPSKSDMPSVFTGKTMVFGAQ